MCRLIWLLRDCWANDRDMCIIDSYAYVGGGKDYGVTGKAGYMDRRYPTATYPPTIWKSRFSYMG